MTQMPADRRFVIRISSFKFDSSFEFLAPILRLSTQHSAFSIRPLILSSTPHHPQNLVAYLPPHPSPYPPPPRPRMRVLEHRTLAAARGFGAVKLAPRELEVCMGSLVGLAAPL